MQRVARQFAAQGFAAHLGLRLAQSEPGHCVIEAPFGAHLTQHIGYFHAGVLTTMADNACGFAALSLMPEGQEVLSVEFKMSFLRPAAGMLARATGRVLKSGKTLSFCQADVHVVDEMGRETLAATMLATMIGVAAV
jgi:uncharacterized protein (TIGR00369 family)